MQSPSSSVSSGNISPAIVGSDKGTKEVYIVGGMVLIVAVAIGAGWHYSGQGQSHVSKTPAEALSNTQVTNVLKTGTNPLAEPILHNQIVPASSYKSDSIHTDIYFEVGRKGLTDDAKAILATQADLAKNDPDLGILVQGYTDQQGSVSYNHKLGLMRAEKVKEFLVGQGVSDQVIKVVSLGKDGALCLDSSDVCRNMNRRVHLEIRKIGQEHMILPTVATELKTSEPIQSANDQGTNTDGHGSLADTLLPSLADPSATDPSPLGTDLASGSYPATSLTLEETESLPGSGQPTESFTLSRFALPRSTMLYARARSSVVRLCLGVLLTVFPPLVSPTATLLAQPAESFSTAVIPTMGINDVTEGTLLLKTNQRGRYIPAPILKTDVQIAVTGIIARATVRQEFTNPNQKKGDWLEGIYVFPLPETAAVDHLRMHVGDRIIEGQIKERGEAKKVYEKAKQEGKRTSLVEQERPNVFTTSVANIGPGERIIVEIEYQETVRYDQGTFQLRFPMAIGQRYIPGTPVIVEDQDPNGSGTMLDTDRVPDASRITPPVQAPGQGSINPVSLTLSLTPGFPIAKVESLFH